MEDGFQPIVCFVDVVVGNEIDLSLIRLVVDRGDANDLGRVAPRKPADALQDRHYGAAGIEHDSDSHTLAVQGGTAWPTRRS